MTMVLRPIGDVVGTIHRLPADYVRLVGIRRTREGRRGGGVRQAS